MDSVQSKIDLFQGLLFKQYLDQEYQEKNSSFTFWKTLVQIASEYSAMDMSVSKQVGDLDKEIEKVETEARNLYQSLEIFQKSCEGDIFAQSQEVTVIKKIQLPQINIKNIFEKRTKNLTEHFNEMQSMLITTMQSLLPLSKSKVK